MTVPLSHVITMVPPSQTRCILTAWGFAVHLSRVNVCFGGVPFEIVVVVLAGRVPCKMQVYGFLRQCEGLKLGLGLTWSTVSIISRRRIDPNVHTTFLDVLGVAVET